MYVCLYALKNISGRIFKKLTTLVAYGEKR